MINKRGEADLNIPAIIGIIVGGALAVAIGLGLILPLVLITQETRESFDTLVATIESLEDGKQTSVAYYLPDGMLLVSFAGVDFNSQRT